MARFGLWSEMPGFAHHWQQLVDYVSGTPYDIFAKSASKEFVTSIEKSEGTSVFPIEQYPEIQSANCMASFSNVIGHWDFYV